VGCVVVTSASAASPVDTATGISTTAEIHHLDSGRSARPCYRLILLWTVTARNIARCAAFTTTTCQVRVVPDGYMSALLCGVPVIPSARGVATDPTPRMITPRSAAHMDGVRLPFSVRRGMTVTHLT
jgi:hypothetical protein